MRNDLVAVVGGDTGVDIGYGYALHIRGADNGLGVARIDPDRTPVRGAAVPDHDEVEAATATIDAVMADWMADRRHLSLPALMLPTWDSVVRDPDTVHATASLS